MKHTSGPWKVDSNELDSLFISDSNDFVIASLCVHESMRENANLIAAAPELLEMLIKLVATMPNEMSLNGEMLRVRARKAIAKATGEES